MAGREIINPCKSQTEYNRTPQESIDVKFKCGPCGIRELIFEGTKNTAIEVVTRVKMKHCKELKPQTRS